MRRSLLSQAQVQGSAGRVLALKDWLSSFEQPGLEVVGCLEHQALALETARRAVTLARDRDGLLPLKDATGRPWLALTPKPADLTPAETSSYVRLHLGDALRGAAGGPLALGDALRGAQGGALTEELTFSLNPSADEISAILQRADGAAGVLVGTFNAIDHPGQAALLDALAQRAAPVIAVALRSPFDVTAVPALGTWLCTYSIQPSAIQALGEALWGRIPFSGSLPVHLPVE